MIIRLEQTKALGEAHRQRYYHELGSAVRNACPDATAEVPDAELEDLVRDGRRRALTYGLTERDDLIRFVRLQLALGHEFDTDGARPWAAEILRVGVGDASARLDALSTRAATEG